MKKLIKKILKPVYTVFVFLAIGIVTLVKKSIFLFKIKSQYKNVYKINTFIQKMYSIVFNPYRISNGIRPNFKGFHQESLSDAEKCHEIIQQKKTMA